MGRINGFITRSSPIVPVISQPAFQSILVQLNINATYLSAYSEAIPVPLGATRVTVQFFHTIANNADDPTTITIEQSSDGVNFFEIPTIDTDPFTIASGSPHTSFNIIGILQNFIRFKFVTIPDSYGFINACTILFA